MSQYDAGSTQPWYVNSLSPTHSNSWLSRTLKFRPLRRLALLLAVSIVLVFGLAVARAASYGSRRPVGGAAPNIAIAEGAAERPAGSLRIPTVAQADPATPGRAALQAPHPHLGAARPAV